ncbi:hypothetical protein [Paenibacillus sp. MMS20-IR301]|uniref:hypothetical protein n=1 Tax=Paenibacillus sp. MMS20-IR301 TaxID=2895946 RepID=UPI0028E7B4B3|nr:hypothetical protein [Paenibacillus sp. MMS20-IR301]WNS45479.1 hypothetical protein LOS79_09470 [Paenibacillus sp. MMS20-IR301]
MQKHTKKTVVPLLGTIAFLLAGSKLMFALRSSLQLVIPVEAVLREPENLLLFR